MSKEMFRMTGILVDCHAVLLATLAMEVIFLFENHCLVVLLGSGTSPEACG